MKKVQRDFIIGDKWLYIKLYTGVKTADTILTEFIKPITVEFLKNDLIEKWFFIRYSDPDFHLRVRFCLTDTSKIGEIISELNVHIKPLIENQLISTFQIDTYSRELERYGTKSIGLIERLFFIDSEITLEMLQLIEGDEGEIYRWQFAIMAVDSLLSGFDYSDIEKLDISDKLQLSFGQEFNMDNELKIQLDKKFRTERQNIRSFLLKENDFYQPFYDILHKKSIDSSSIIEDIKALHEKGELEVDLNALLSSCIHMLLNRIFKSEQRLNEMVIYSLLFRFYKSEIARKKHFVELH